ncbi:MAG: class I SAM-dependent methyltransferase [Planctomycetota bacterium]
MPEPPDLSRLVDDCTDPAAAQVVQRGYLRWFAKDAAVLDVGCGTGGFLQLLRESGRRGVGIDSSHAAAARCRQLGLDVHHGEAFAVLADLARDGRSFGGVMLAHVLEHLDGQAAQALLTAIAAVLAPGGTLLVATPNFANLIVATEVFWLDPTHVRPYPRQLIERLGRAAGLQVVASFDDPLTTPRRTWWRRAVARCRSALGGADRSSPMDAVVVLRKPM